MNMKLLCRVFIRVILSVVFAGIFYSAWMAVAIPVLKLVPSGPVVSLPNPAEGSGLDIVVLKTILWLAAPVVTALGFTTGVFISELLQRMEKKVKLHSFTTVASSPVSAKPAVAHPPPPLAMEGYPFRIHQRIFTRGFLRRRVKFLNIFKWSLAGCAIGAGSVVWFGPMLIVFGMFLAGTASIALREIVRLRRDKRNIPCDS